MLDLFLKSLGVMGILAMGIFLTLTAFIDVPDCRHPDDDY